MQSLDSKFIQTYKKQDVEGCYKIAQEILELSKIEKVEDEETRKRLLWNLDYVTPKNKGLNIGFYCYKSDKVGEWDPFSIERGIAGSEEAVIYCAEKLSKNHTITVYANPPANSFPWKSAICNPRYTTVEDIVHIRFQHDIIICWRRVDFTTAKERAKKVFYWPHDICTGEIKGKDLDGILWLSKYQKEQYLEKCPELRDKPHVICGNGIDLDYFLDLKSRENPYSCGYFSNYSRGLTNLLDIWTEVKKKFPKATLEIFYGRETWGSMSNEDLEKLVKRIQLFKKRGVYERGKLGHEELAEKMKEISIWTYPCTTDTETFCITAIKAQAAGMIPVTTRIGALEETVHPEAPSLPIYNCGKYKELLLQTMQNIEKEDRKKYKEFAENFTWENCVNSWLELYQKC